MAQDYDVTLKLLFRQSKGRALRQLIGGAIAEWLDVELPRVENPRVDLLAKLDNGSYVHLELQSSNEEDFGRRQAEYYLGLHRILKQHVRQVAVYIGREKLRMKAAFETPSLQFQFEMMDVRELDPEPLLTSDDVGDNLLALLTEADKRKVFRAILARMPQLSREEQTTAAMQFVILSNLREIEPQLLEEVKRQMRPLVDVTEGPIFGPIYRKGVAEGEQKGRQEGERILVRRLLEKRFGSLPPEILQRLEQANEAELEQIGLRLISAASMQDVFSAEHR